MTWALVAALILAATALALWWRERAQRRRPPSPLRQRRSAVQTQLRALVDAVPDHAPLLSAELPAHPAAATIEAHLLAGEPQAALHAAERAVAEQPRDAAAHILLARALWRNDALVPAAAELVRARELGASGPLVDLVDGCVEHLLWLRRVNPGRAEVQTQLLPPLVTPFDRFVLSLARHEQGSESAAWLTGAGGNTTLDAATISALVRQHHDKGLASLELLVRAASRAPGARELVYHAARRALQTGFVEEGRGLLEKLGPLMADAPERKLFERDRAAAEGETLPTPPEDEPPTPPGAKRSARLNIVK